jgi:hypothetical protein
MAVEPLPAYFYLPTRENALVINLDMITATALHFFSITIPCKIVLVLIISICIGFVNI